MQKPSRRPHGAKARKISISVTEDDLRLLSRRARRAHGGNVSAVIHELAATLRRQEAADHLLELLGGDHVTSAEMDAIRAEISREQASQGGVTALTFDTGALIALERRRQRMRAVFKTARVDGIPILVPSVCVAEWWRGRTDVREAILASVIVVHTDDALVKLAGQAQALIPSATCVDTLVMATAARFGDVVFTSDVEDLFLLQRAFPSVRVLGV